MNIDPKLALIGTINIVLKSRVRFGNPLDDTYIEINPGLVQICCDSLNLKVTGTKYEVDPTQVEELLNANHPMFRPSGFAVNGEPEWLIDFTKIVPRLSKDSLTEHIVSRVVDRLEAILMPDKTYPREVLKFLLR